MKLYTLSGLGADRRFFVNLEKEGLQFEHIDWIEPLKNETLSEYARRIMEQHIHEEEFNLIGLSFGGMVAQEIAKLKQPKKLILLSTIVGKHQLPWYLRAAGTLRLHKLISDRLLTSNNQFSRYIFGANHPEIEPLFKPIIEGSDPDYLRWAMHSILRWKNKHESNAIRIHGTKDRLLPIRKKIEHRIEGGGHLMLIDKAQPISKIIRNYLAE